MDYQTINTINVSRKTLTVLTYIDIHHNNH